MDVRVELWRRLSTKELMLLNCGVGEDSWESLGLQGDPTSPFWRRSPWDYFGRNDAKAETPVLWPPHVKSWLIGKDFDAGRDWGQEKKGTTEDEMAGWHHGLDGRESEWTQGVGDGQGGLACCNSWGRKESGTTERLNWTDILCSQRWRSSIQSAKTRPGADCGLDHELLIAKFTLKLKKVEKSTRPFRYTTTRPIRRLRVCVPSWSASFLGFPGGSEVKASASNAGDTSSIPGLRRSPGEGNGNPLHYSCLENPMDGEAW